MPPLLRVRLSLASPRTHTPTPPSQAKNSSSGCEHEHNHEFLDEPISDELVDFDADLDVEDKAAKNLHAKELELNQREHNLKQREKCADKMKQFMRNKYLELRAQCDELERVKQQVARAANTRRHLLSLPSTSACMSEQVPEDIRHQSYLAGQIAHDLNNLHKQMAHSPATGKLINEMPEVYALAAQLKAAKNGTPEATQIHQKIKMHIEGMAAQLLRGKLEHAKLSGEIKRRADDAFSSSVAIGKLKMGSIF